MDLINSGLQSLKQAPKKISRTLTQVSQAPAKLLDKAPEKIAQKIQVIRKLETAESLERAWKKSVREHRQPLPAPEKAKLEFLPSDQALGYGLSQTMKAGRGIARKALGQNGVEQADRQAAELEHLKRQRFEAKLKAQNPARHQAYSRRQAQAEKSIQADANPETHRRREFREQEAQRAKTLFARDPQTWKRELSTEKRQTFEKREQSDLRDLEASSSPEAADKSALRRETSKREAQLLPKNKMSWLQSLSPEQRDQYLKRHEHDQASILLSGMKANQAKDVIKDVATLGANSAQKSNGVKGAAAEIFTLGLHGIAKQGGEDLGRGQAYLAQAENANRSGSYISSLQFRQQGESIQDRGALSTGMAVVGANSMRPLLNNGATRAYWAIEEAVVKRRPIGPGQRASALNEVTPAQQAQLAKMFEEVGGDPSKLVFNQGRQTGYVDSKDIIRVRGDVFPSPHQNHPRSTMTPRAVLAHERGHEAHRGTKLAVGSWNDEFRASYWAAKKAPGLSAEERASLIADCIERAREGGVPIKVNAFMRKTLYGY